MILLIALIFIILLSAPLIGSGIYYKRVKAVVLAINQEKVKDPRYFGKSFSTLIESKLSDLEDNTIVLSKPEVFIDADIQDKYHKSIDKLVIARNSDYRVSTVDEFQKEIYGGKDVILSGHKQLRLRAVYSKENMIIGSNTHVIRWVDANGTLAVYDNCNLGVSTSSRIRMSIGRNCKFQRLYAPEIRIGQYPQDKFDARDGKNPRIYNMPIQTNKEKNVKYIASEMINDDGVVNYTVVCRENLNIIENIIIQGDVRSNRGVRLGDNAVVCGNVFAEKDIYLGKNACVLGNIFSQENIYFEESAVVGQEGRISSVIARGRITFEKKNFVFGFVSCERQGLIATGQIKDDVSANKEVQFLKRPIKKNILEFKDLYEYEHVDQQGFRNNKGLEKVIIPNKATIIPRSMFFNCQSLHTAILPVMLKSIKPYSFADCKSLREPFLAACLNLEEIGISAFENCKSIRFVEIPASVKSIDGAAFSGCIALKGVSFAEGSKLIALEDHCFNGCKLLEEIRIPQGVKTIGVSAFRGCSNLSKIILPETCKNEPGILEIPKEKLEFYEIFSKEMLVNENE